MKILIYSTNSGMAGYSYSAVHTYFPSRTEDWKMLAGACENDEFYVCCCLAGNQAHIVDWYLDPGDETQVNRRQFHFIALNPGDSSETIAAQIKALEPDVAIAWGLPNVIHDWNPVKDALVADILRAEGIRTICHSADFAMSCFEKNKSSELLKANGMKAPEFVHVQNSLFKNPYAEKISLFNVYREYIYSQIKKLKFPVVIKPSAGAGSTGIVVAESFEHAAAVLESDANSSDLMVEEKIEGESFGIEVYGCNGKYSVLPLVKFTTTPEGITDPFTSIKYGPITGEKYNTAKLKRNLINLAVKCDWQGGVELDLIFNGEEWYVVDINPRFSLMSHVACAMINKNDIANIIDVAKGDIRQDYSLPDLTYAVDFKSGVDDDNILEAVRKEFPFIRKILKFHIGNGDKKAINFSELTLCSADGFQDILTKVGQIRNKYPEIVSEKVYAQIAGLCI